MPRDRYLAVHDLWPQQDGSFRLRDGYALLANGLQPGVPIHSIVSVVGPGPDRHPFIVFWQGTTPYVYDTVTRVVSAPTVKGAAVASSARFSYFYTNGHLHAFNGTDAKWFDGVVWRDIGLPTLSAEELVLIAVREGMASVSAAEAAAVTVTVVPGTGSWLASFDPAELFLAFFDTATNLLAPSTFKLGSGPDPIPAANDEWDLANLPLRSPTSVVGLLGFELVPGNASFLVDGIAELGTMTGSGTTVTVSSTAHGLTTGDVITLITTVIYPNHTVLWPSNGPFAITRVDADHFTFQSPKAPLYVAAAPNYLFIKLQTIANGATSYAVKSNLAVLNQGTQFNVDGLNLLPYVDSPAVLGLAASSIGGSNPGYQFYAAIYNLTTGHVGNRQPIGLRLINASNCLVSITGLPDFSSTDTEWVILIGRTSDGAEIPYAIIDSSGNWIYVPNGQTSVIITQSNIDGNAELPSRNFPPPGTLDYDYQVSQLPQSQGGL